MTERSPDQSPQGDHVDEVQFPPNEDGTLPPPELVDRVKGWLREDPRGRQVMAHMMGEGPEPKPLFTAVEDDEQNRSLLLGSGEVDVTELEPDADRLLDELFEEDDPGE